MTRSGKRADAGKGLRSSFDLAMERLGTSPTEEGALSSAQIERINEIDREYRARIAESEVMLASRMAAAAAEGDAELMGRLRDEYAQDVARFREAMDREKDEVREGSGRG